MFFYVFLQPEVFSESAVDGEEASQNLAAILGGFLQNCFLAVYEDYHWEPIVKEMLDDWPETMTRRRVKSLLVQFKKHKRFLYCIAPDYTGVELDLSCAFEQATSIPLDLILMICSAKSRPAPPGIEVTTRQSYHSTNFEENRSALAVHGKTCSSGEMDEAEFLNFHLMKALRYAEEIHICDRICGKSNFRDNFRYTIKQLLDWLGHILINPADCKIVFHLGQPTGHGDHHILTELSSFKSRHLSSTPIEVRFYDESHPEPILPHQRFIVTDQIALNIDRGMDFLDRNTHKCRDTYINYQDPQEANTLLRNCSPGCVLTQTI